MGTARPDRAFAREQVVASYRYLRLAQVVLVVVLGASVVADSLRAHRVLGSISSYYYTSAREALAASLLAIGVGLVAIQGGSRLEDALLNLAGMCAPVVGFVPTTMDRPPGLDRGALAAQVGVDLTGLLAGSVTAIVLLVAVAVTRRRERGRRRAGVGDVLGVLAGVGLVAATTAWYLGDRTGFLDHAHVVAAAAMFVLFGLVVAVNARRGPYRRGYGVIVGLMVAVQLVWLTVPLWHYAVLVVETALITLFAAFWLVQTWQLRAVESAAV